MHGVLDHRFFAVDGGPPTPADHQEAAIDTVRAIGEALPAASVWRVSVDEVAARAAAPEPIDAATFMGPLYDIPSATLWLRGQERLLNHYFAPGDPEEQAHARSIDREGALGYAHAFCDPPYGLSIPRPRRRDETAELFAAVVREIFGGFAEGHAVMRHGVDFSNYFDAGKEWWGAALWTFFEPRSALLVGIAASTTD